MRELLAPGRGAASGVLTRTGWQGLDRLPEPYRQDGLIEWGSITKAATAAAFEVAVNQGLLRDDLEVRRLLPDHDQARFTSRSLVEHTSGLPRTHAGMGAGLWRDPYRDLVGSSLSPALFAPGQSRAFVYSNLGYALLGRILDRVAGGWWERVLSTVLHPAGVTTATLDPDLTRRVTRTGWRRRSEEPWPIGLTDYAAAGGIWSTFEDLRKFTAWSLHDSSRRTAWRQEGDAIWVNGRTRSSGCCILATSAGDRAAVVHTVGRAPSAADRIALRILRESVYRA